MIHRITVFFIIAILFSAGSVLAQRRMPQGGTVTGQVFDQVSQNPVQYANVLLFSAPDSVQIDGAASDKDGNFVLERLKPGQYYAQVYFVGYHVKPLEDISVYAGGVVDLGRIPLERTAIMLEGAQVQVERPTISYQIDKKVVNVSRDYTAASGSAVDVLENVASVEVDIEGNVSLRGNPNFTVMIDNRPSILEPNEALQQIPASMIKDIEIITNPSAKHDPDGIAGIINIVMKKEKLQGVSGIVNGNVGTRDNYGGDFLFTCKDAAWEASFGADYRQRNHPGERKIERETYNSDYTSYLHSEGERLRNHKPMGVRGSFALHLSPSDVVDVGGRYGDRTGEGGSKLHYDEWKSSDNLHHYYSSNETSTRSGDYYSVDLGYNHSFDRKGHTIAGKFNTSRRGGDEESVTETLDQQGMISSGRKTTESGPSNRLRMNLDYTLPFNENERFEAGYQSRIDKSSEENGLWEYDPVGDQYVWQSEFSHDIDYNRDIHSLYATYSGEWKKFGYQAGIRGEYMNRNTELVETGEKFEIDRNDYFPSVHLSYSFSEIRQIMASYTRRIERPRGWWLEPFVTWSDAYNVRSGNPSLKPEYIDAWEIGHQTRLGKNNIMIEAYYHVTDNMVERVSSIYAENVILQKPENVGTEYNFGAELTLRRDLFEWWDINLMGSLFNTRIKGLLYDEAYSHEDLSWNMRLNNELNIGKLTRVQINARYNGAEVQPQGREEASFTTDLAIRQELIRKRLSMTLQMRDIFGTAVHEETSRGDGFYYHSTYTHQPMISLSIAYNFNNYRPERRNGDGEGFEDGEDF